MSPPMVDGRIHLHCYLCKRADRQWWYKPPASLPFFPCSPVEHMPCSSWSSARPPCLLGLSPYPQARELARMACPIITQYGKATPPAALLCAAPWTPRDVLSERRCQDSRQPCIVCLEQYFSNLSFSYLLAWRCLGEIDMRARHPIGSACLELLYDSSRSATYS